MEEEDDERIILNVGGQKYEVSTKTLIRYPNTLLGNMFLPENKHLRKPDKKGEYFFDRNPKIFEIIIDFYRTGKLTISPDIILKEKIIEELKFFKIHFEENEIENEIEEEENEINKIKKENPENIIKFTFNLLQKNKFKVKQSIELLEDLLNKKDNNIDNILKEIYYQLAFGYHRLGNSFKALLYIKKILEIDPNDHSAISLNTLIEDKSFTNKAIGLLFILFLTGGVLFRIWKK